MLRGSAVVSDLVVTCNKWTRENYVKISHFEHGPVNYVKISHFENGISFSLDALQLEGTILVDIVTLF